MDPSSPSKEPETLEALDSRKSGAPASLRPSVRFRKTKCTNASRAIQAVEMTRRHIAFRTSADLPVDLVLEGWVHDHLEALDDVAVLTVWIGRDRVQFVLSEDRPDLNHDDLHPSFVHLTNRILASLLS